MALHNPTRLGNLHMKAKEDVAIGSALLDDWERRSCIVRRNFRELASAVDTTGVGDWRGLSDLLVRFKMLRESMI